jgi:hypothetical protein
VLLIPRRILILFLCYCAPLIYGQGTGSITGTVRDATGAAIPKADVVLTDTATANSNRATTNSDGEYLFAAVPPGVYDLTVTAKGFNKFEVKGVILRVAQRARVEANLTVGEIRSAVTVEGEAMTQVETESSEVSGVVTGKEISQIVLNGRNFTQLVTLTPGVSNQTGQDEGTVGVYGSVAFSINGGRTEYNNWEIDGGDNMDNGSNGTLNVYPNVDAIAEVRVLTSNYGAQYGRSGSGTVETVTKSGRQGVSTATLAEFVRNDAFNARNFFASDVPSYKKNDYSYTIGGPVWIPGRVQQQEGQRRSSSGARTGARSGCRTPSTSQVPSTGERQGNFSDVCPASNAMVRSTQAHIPDCPVNPLTGNYYPGNTVAIDPNAQALMTMVPAPTTGSGATSFFNASPSTPTNWREELVRIDQNFSDSTRFFFRYIHDSWNTITPTSLWSGDSFPTVGTNFVGPGVSLVAHLANNITPTLLNELTFSYTTDHIFLTPSGTWKRPSGMTMGSLFDNGFGDKLTSFSINNGAPYGGGFTADVAGYPWNNANPTYTYRDQVAKIWGSHNIYAGFYHGLPAEERAEQPGDAGLAGLQQLVAGQHRQRLGRLPGRPDRQLLAGQCPDEVLLPLEDVRAVHPGRLAHFAQADPEPRLRMSGFGSYYEKYKQFYNFFPSHYDPAQAPQIDVTGNITGVQGALVPGVGNPYNGAWSPAAPTALPNTCYKGHFMNWAPRLGFAFDPVR